MTDEPFHRLRKAREDAGYASAKEAADRYHWGYSTYASHENGDRGLRGSSAKRYAEAFKVSYAWLLTGAGEPTGTTVPSLKVAAEAAAGRWLEEGEATDFELGLVPAHPDTNYPHDYQYAVRMVGNSADRLAPPGSYAIAIPLEHARLLRDGDIVVVARRRENLVETTVRRLEDSVERQALSFESNDPRYQTKIDMRDERSDDVGVQGLVLAIFTNYS